MVGRWGMSGGDRPARGAPARRLGPVPARAPPRSRPTRSELIDERGAPHRRGVPSARWSRCCSENRDKLDSLAQRAARARDARRGRRLRGGRRHPDAVARVVPARGRGAVAHRALVGPGPRGRREERGEAPPGACTGRPTASGRSSRRSSSAWTGSAWTGPVVDGAVAPPPWSGQSPFMPSAAKAACLPSNELAAGVCELELGVVPEPLLDPRRSRGQRDGGPHDRDHPDQGEREQEAAEPAGSVLCLHASPFVAGSSS